MANKRGAKTKTGQQKDKKQYPFSFVYAEQTMNS